VSAALFLCLNIGVDPPDVVKTHPCAKLECWIDPESLPPPRALEKIGKNLQEQYETLSMRTRYKLQLDPRIEDGVQKTSEYYSTTMATVSPNPLAAVKYGSLTGTLRNISLFPCMISWDISEPHACMFGTVLPLVTSSMRSRSLQKNEMQRLPLRKLLQVHRDQSSVIAFILQPVELTKYCQ